MAIPKGRKARRFATAPQTKQRITDFRDFFILLNAFSLAVLVRVFVQRDFQHVSFETNDFVLAVTQLTWFQRGREKCSAGRTLPIIRKRIVKLFKREIP